MRRHILASAKPVLVRAGALLSVRAGGVLPAWATHGLQAVAGYVAAGRWVADNGFDNAPRLAGRDDVFDAMMAEVGAGPIAYLEFGVFEGASLKYWVRGIHDPESEFHGFDSFEGLPETFDSTYPVGHFDKGGQAPRIDDDRVHFHVGWFEETLPGFIVPAGKRLVITLDADLYSATKLVLTTLDRHICPGTVVYFDELSRAAHEPAAFDDYRAAAGKRFEAIAFDQVLNRGAFICR